MGNRAPYVIEVARGVEGASTFGTWEGGCIVERKSETRLSALLFSYVYKQYAL